MNKQNRILLGVLAFIVACTIGYALFSETITISGTATAKGDFSITTTCTKGIDAAAKIGTGIEGQEEGYSNDTCTVSGDTVTYHADLAYPTAYRLFTVKMTNTGSITAEAIVNTAFVITASYCEYDNTTNAQVGDCVNQYDSGNAFISNENAYFEVNGTKYYGNEENADDLILNEAGTGYILKPGDSMYFIMKAKWPSDKNSSTNYYVGTGSFAITWSQITAQ